VKHQNQKARSGTEADSQREERVKAERGLTDLRPQATSFPKKSVYSIRGKDLTQYGKNGPRLCQEESGNLLRKLETGG